LIQLIFFAKYYQDNEIRECDIGRSCSAEGEVRNAYKNLVGKTKGKEPLGRPRRRWDDIRMDHRFMRVWTQQ
jgi:hypothetical protein